MTDYKSNRIKELAPQCWELTEFGLNFNYQKFAELIVQECIDTAFHRGHPDLEFLLKHFGVEE